MQIWRRRWRQWADSQCRQKSRLQSIQNTFFSFFFSCWCSMQEPKNSQCRNVLSQLPLPPPAFFFFIINLHPTCTTSNTSRFIKLGTKTQSNYAENGKFWYHFLGYLKAMKGFDSGEEEDERIVKKGWFGKWRRQKKKDYGKNEIRNVKKIIIFIYK